VDTGFIVPTPLADWYVRHEKTPACGSGSSLAQSCRTLFLQVFRNPAQFQASPRTHENLRHCRPQNTILSYKFELIFGEHFGDLNGHFSLRKELAVSPDRFFLRTASKECAIDTRLCFCWDCEFPDSGLFKVLVNGLVDQNTLWAGGRRETTKT
jgi:hypothetical protein